MTEEKWLTSDDPVRMLTKAVRNGVPRRKNEPGSTTDWISNRKLRLFACACCWQVWDLLTDERSRRAVEVAERFADGLATTIELDVTEDNARSAWQGSDNPAGAARYCCLRQAIHAVECITRPEMKDLPSPVIMAALLREIAGNPYQPATLPTEERMCWDCRGYGTHLGAGPDRGNPECSTCHGTGKLSSCPWLTPLVVSLAQAAYDQREQKCGPCKGRGFFMTNAYLYQKGEKQICGCCHGTGIISNTLDLQRLSVLSDALEEAGCESERKWICDGSGKHSHWGRAGEVIHGVLHETDPCHPHHHHDEKCWKDIPNPILVHLRSPGPHVRGCWVVDLILGKE